MKRFLLAMSAVAMMCVAAVAQTTWTAPAPPASDVVSSETDTVYLYNCGAGQFLCGGTTWGTHGALSTTGLPIRLTCGADETSWTIYFWEGSKSQQILGREGDSNTYIDYNGQSGWCIVWNFNPVGDGSYTINADDTKELFLGQVPTRVDYDKDGGEIGQGVGVWADVDPTEEDAHIEWLVVTKSDFDSWNLVNGKKQTLLTLINEAENAGLTVDANILAVLDDADATEEDVLKAIAALKAQMVTELGKDASEDNPVDFTSLFIVNPDFDSKSTSGWTLTGSYAKTQNNNPHYIEVENPDGTWETTDEVGLDTGGWLEFWKSGGIDATQDAHQVIEDLPVGMYRLELVGIGLGGYLYAYTNGVRQEQGFSTHLEHVSFDFMHVGGDLKMGMDYQPGTATTSWVAVDKFRLYYLGVGDEDPSLTMLRKACKELSYYLDEDAEHYYSNSLRAEVKSVYDEAMVLVDGLSEDSEANVAAQTKIQEVKAKADTEIAVYQAFYTFVNTTIPADIEKYAEIESPAYGNFVSYAEDFLEECENIYGECELSGEELTDKMEMYASVLQSAHELYKDEVRQAWQAAAEKGETLDEPIELTMLFDNLDFPLAEQDNATLQGLGWTSNSDAYKSRSYTAEVWNTTFEVSRVLTELPKGKYTIRTKALYRESDNQTNYDAFVNGETGEYAFLFAGAKQSSMLNVASVANAVSLNSNDATISAADESELYVPNSMEGAWAWFNNYENAECFEVEVSSSVINNGGDLTFGVRGVEGLGDNCWVIWQGFEVFYNGVSASALDDEIAALIEQALSMNTCGVAMADEKIAAACEQGEMAYDVKDEAVKTAAIEALKAAIAYAEESATLVAKLYSVVETYNLKMEALDPDHSYTGEDYLGLLDAVNTAVAEEYFESNEQIESWLTELVNGWVPYLMSRDDIETASEDNPIDVTEVFVNADFETTCSNYATPEGWTLELEKQTGNVVSNAGGYECWNSGTFCLYQEFVGLKEGYYSLTIDGYYRVGSSDDAVNALLADTCQVNAFLFAGDKTTPLYDWIDLTQVVINDETKGNELSGLQKTVNNDKIWAPNNGTSAQLYFADGRYVNNTVQFQAGAEAIRMGVTKPEVCYSNDWIYFDNVHLFFLGTEAPTGVEEVNAANANANANAIRYNLAGQRVGANYRGIVIVNGKKMLK